MTAVTVAVLRPRELLQRRLHGGRRACQVGAVEIDRRRRGRSHLQLERAGDGRGGRDFQELDALVSGGRRQGVAAVCCSP